MSKNLGQEPEAHIHWAEFAALECGISALVPEAEEQRLEALKEDATVRLKSIDFNAAPLQDLADEAEHIRRMLQKGGMSNSEMRMVVKAMSKEFGGTGHWYRCENGHPFTIGECGMPMELAKCPECGAGVGGRQHQAKEGATHARDIEERFRGLQLRGRVLVKGFGSC